MNNILKRIVLIPFNVLYKICPSVEQRLMFRLKMGYSLDLNSPKTYNEKLNWLKLKYRNKLMPVCADKFAARGYIEQCGYGQYLPTLYWHGFKGEDIPFDMLPTSFVIKSTSGSGNNIIVRNKEDINRAQIIKTVNKWMKEKYLLGYGEWMYEQINSSIIVEEFLSDGMHNVPVDYKLFCFNNIHDGNGNVGCVAVDKGRYVNHRRNIHDSDFKFLPDVSFGFERDFTDIDNKPACFDELCVIATKLAEPFPHCRVDFYIIGDRFYIGEITFFNGAGYDKISPDAFNMKMGNWIQLPDDN